MKAETLLFQMENCTLLIAFICNLRREKKKAFQISTTAITAMLCSPTLNTPPSNKAFSPGREMAASLQEDSCD